MEFLQAWKKNNKEDHLVLAVLGIGHLTLLLVFLLSVLQLNAQGLPYSFLFHEVKGHNHKYCSYKEA